MIDWESVREECINTGGKVKIMKEEGVSLPSYFHKSDLGLAKGALFQYRDDRAAQSLHIHEFPEYFLAHVDTFNPEHHPVAHGIVDTPGITLAIVLGLFASFFLVKTAKSLSFVPKDDVENW